jgi:glucose-6-phosphate 1-dehydrogenase
VLKSLRRIDRSNVREKTVRGQYTAGRQLSISTRIATKVSVLLVLFAPSSSR